MAFRTFVFLKTLEVTAKIEPAIDSSTYNISEIVLKRTEDLSGRDSPQCYHEIHCVGPICFAGDPSEVLVIAASVEVPMLACEESVSGIQDD
jgi:hypothetical protein